MNVKMAFDITLALTWNQLLDDLAKIEARLLCFRSYRG